MSRTERRKRIIYAAILFGAILVIFLTVERPRGGGDRHHRVGSGTEPSLLGADRDAEVKIMPMAAALDAQLRQPDALPEDELGAVDQLLYHYRQGFGENPVGQNEDVVAALLGQNSKQTAWLSPQSPSIVDGKLVDRWGSPYWFHPVSGKHMEVRSAGPDRELFTADDLALP